MGGAPSPFGMDPPLLDHCAGLLAGPDPACEVT